jgi:hypothetical protein
MNRLKHKNIKIFLNYVLGPLLFCLAVYSIFKQIKNQPHLEESWLRSKSSFTIKGSQSHTCFIFNVCQLVAGSLKWKYQLHVQPVSFFRSLKAILSGVFFSNYPNRVGGIWKRCFI